MNRDEAIKATRNGAIAACISGGLTLAVVLIAISSNSQGSIALWNDPSNFFDILLIFGCAYGVYKKSRTAAIVLFVYFILAKIIIGIETGQATGIGLGLVFLYFYGRAIQGAFVFHKIEKADNPDYKPTPKWIYFTGIPLLAILAIVMGLGVLTMTGTLPSTEVQSGSEITQSNKDLLISNTIIFEEDRIEYFYSGGFASILEGGSVLTDDRVILYFPDDAQEQEVYEIYLNNVSAVELIEKGDVINDSIYKIHSREPDSWLQIALSAEDGGDIKFIEALSSKISNANL